MAREAMGKEPLNKVAVSGYVKWEPNVVKAKQEGHSDIVQFSIEHEHSYGKKSVFPVKAFGKVAEEFLKDNVAVGDYVIVNGEKVQSRWKDKTTGEWKERQDIDAKRILVAVAEDDIPF